MRRILVTGGAGFIGSHLIQRLISEDAWEVCCVDNFDDFYPPEIKHRNIRQFIPLKNFKLVECDILNPEELARKVAGPFEVIVHLAARAGVRPSIMNPALYQNVNTLGTQNLLELAHKLGIKQFVFGSSSSVYGVNPNVPWKESDSVLLPISPYAATKVAGELLGHVYSHLYGIRFVALRLFTVIGPAQRPDLAIHKFVELMVKDQEIPVYGDGSTQRDYTYVTDIVSGIRSAIDYTGSLYEIINLGNNHVVRLDELIRILEETLGKKCRIKRLPEQSGDVPRTWASIEKAGALLSYSPAVSIEAGIKHFWDWYKDNALRK